MSLQVNTKAVEKAVGKKVKLATYSQVIRRACRNPQTIQPNLGYCYPAFSDEYPEGWDYCPRCGFAAKIEDRGVLGYWNRNPLKRLGFWIRKRISNGPVNA